MADDKDLDSLAKGFLDLWQDQVSALASDPDFAAALQRCIMTASPLGQMGMGQMGMGQMGMGQMGMGPTDAGQSGAGDQPGAMAAWPAMLASLAMMGLGGAGATTDRQGSDAKAKNGQTADSGSGSATGPATARASSHPDGPDLDELLGRLAALEKRIATLEGSGARNDSDGKREAKPKRPPRTARKTRAG